MPIRVSRVPVLYTEMVFDGYELHERPKAFPNVILRLAYSWFEVRVIWN